MPRDTVSPVQPAGPLLAAGRDCDIYEHGPGRVLRRARAERSLEPEARVMAYLHGLGYPVPEVEEVSADGRDLVMERVDGPSMVQAIGSSPWTVRRQGKLLGELHRQLHDLPAPDFLTSAPVGEGHRLVHLDLHPLNVLIGPKGPVVIDWTGACIGDPDVDVGLAWALMACGQIPGGRAVASLLGLGRSLLVNAFLSGFDRAAVGAKLHEVVAWKVADPHMSKEEVAAMWRLVERAGRGR